MWMGGVRDTRDKEEADKVDGSHQMGSTDKEDKECDKVLPNLLRGKGSHHFPLCNLVQGQRHVTLPRT